MASRTDEDGYVTDFAYDSRNLVQAISYSGGKNVRFTYNPAEQLVGMSDWTGETTFALDLLGRVTSVNDSSNRTVGYTYDRAGNIASIAYPDTAVVRYSYDAHNRFASVADADGASTSYEYDAAGRLVRLNYN